MEKKSWTYGEEYRHTKVEYRSRQSHVQSCRSLLMLGSCQRRHNAWHVVTSQSLFRFGNCLILLWSKYVRFQIVPTFNQVLVFLFFCKEFLRFFLFYSFKIAKRVKKNPRLSNFRDTACQLVTEIGKTCGIGLIVSNRECLILFCITQMTKF